MFKIQDFEIKEVGYPREGKSMDTFIGVPGYANLSDEQKQLFRSVHRSHLKAMGTDNQKKYALENVKKVVWSKEELTVNVYYEDNWWHYDRRGCWY